MILDKLSHAHLYYTLHKRFKEAFAFIEAHHDKPFASQRTHLDGENLIAICEAPDPKGREGARLEAHRKYIDIQYTYEGIEEIGWKFQEECKHITHPYKEEKDIEFYSDTSNLWLPVPKGFFAIFFPHDAHAPLATKTPIKKIIMKIAYA